MLNVAATTQTVDPNLASKRRRAIGLTIGSLWLIVAGGGFAAWALIDITTAPARLALIASALLLAALGMIGASTMRAALRLPGKGAPGTARSRAMRMHFGWVVAAEFAAIFAANAAVMPRYELLPSLDVFIVGLHFLPLAHIFHVPRYYALGAWFCIIPAASLLALSPAQRIGSALAWYVLPGLVCGAGAVLTGALGLREVRRSRQAA